MIKPLLITLIIISTMNATAQQFNKRIYDEAWKKDIMINECTREGILGLEEMKAAYDREYADYTVDSTLLKEIKPMLQSKTMLIVMATWCGDSRYQVPHFYKILDQLSFPEKNIRLIALDGHKKAEKGLVDGMDIKRVPTFLVYENGKEIGRIIERPVDTLEKDLLNILSTKN